MLYSSVKLYLLLSLNSYDYHVIHRFFTHPLVIFTCGYIPKSAQKLWRTSQLIAEMVIMITLSSIGWSKDSWSKLGILWEMAPVGSLYGAGNLKTNFTKGKTCNTISFLNKPFTYVLLKKLSNGPTCMYVCVYVFSWSHCMLVCRDTWVAMSEIMFVNLSSYT